MPDQTNEEWNVNPLGSDSVEKAQVEARARSWSCWFSCVALDLIDSLGMDIR